MQDISLVPAPDPQRANAGQKMFPENVNNFYPANSGAWLAASNIPGQPSPFREHFLALVAYSMTAVAWFLASVWSAPLFLS